MLRVVYSNRFSTRYKRNVRTIYGKDAIVINYLSFMVYRSGHISCCARNHCNYIVFSPAVCIKAWSNLPVLFEGTFRKMYTTANDRQRATGPKLSTALQRLTTVQQPTIIIFNARRTYDTCHLDLAKVHTTIVEK